LQPGESSLALDEEMLQFLDAADPVKAACSTTLNRHAQKEPGSAGAFAPPRPLVPTAHEKKENDLVQMGNGASPQPTDGRPSRGPSSQEGDCNGDCKRPGWRTDCRDLAQKLLFSEDSGEVNHPQRDQDNFHSKPASVSAKPLPCQKAVSSSM